MPTWASSDALNATTMNKALSADGTPNVQVPMAARIQYTGAVWQIVSATEQWGLVGGDLAWNVDRLSIDISGFAFANPPLVFATPCAVGSSGTPASAGYTPAAHATSLSNVDVIFTDAANLWVTTEDTRMDFQLLILGTDS